MSYSSVLKFHTNLSPVHAGISMVNFFPGATSCVKRSSLGNCSSEGSSTRPWSRVNLFVYQKHRCFEH